MQKVVKDISYHESAVRYNEELAEFAEKLAETIEHPEPRRWCRSVAKQHRFHATRHQRGLNKLLEEEEGATFDTEDGGEDTVIDDQRTVHRSAVSGRFVDEEMADENPDTTVEEHIDAPRASGDVHNPFVAVTTPSDDVSAMDAPRVDAVPDPELAAEPVEAGVGTGERELTDQEKADLAEAQAAAAKERGTNG